MNSIWRAQAKENVRIFGVPLARLISADKDERVPPVFKKLCECLLQHGGSTSGIFRVSGSSQTVEELKYALERWGSCVLDNYSDQSEIHAMASVLKAFIRLIPGGLIPKKITEEMINILKQHFEQSATLIKNFRSCLRQLSRERLNVLEYLCRFLAAVSERSMENLMSTQNLGIIFGPCVFRFYATSQELDSQNHANQIMEILIAHHATIFKNLKSDCGQLSKLTSLSLLANVPNASLQIGAAFAPGLKTSKTAVRQSVPSGSKERSMKHAVISFADYLALCSEEMALDNGSKSTNDNTKQFSSAQPLMPDSRWDTHLDLYENERTCHSQQVYYSSSIGIQCSETFSKRNMLEAMELNQTESIDECDDESEISMHVNTGSTWNVCSNSGDECGSSSSSYFTVNSIELDTTSDVASENGPNSLSDAVQRFEEKQSIHFPIHVFLNLLLLVLVERRQLCCRPARISLMTKEQLRDEWIDLQKGKVYFEHVYGTLISRHPQFYASAFYNRYQVVKRLMHYMVRGKLSFPIRKSTWRCDNMFRNNSSPELFSPPNKSLEMYFDTIV